MPSARSVRSRIVCPAPLASADAVVADQRPLGRHAAVVEDGLADELDLDVAVDALDRPHEHVVGVVVGGRTRVRRDLVLVVARPHRERVAHDDPAGRRLPGRFEHVRSRLVDARGRVRDPERPEPEDARLRSSRLPNMLGESNAGRTSQSTAPSGAISAPVWQFGEERVLGDRRERRRSGRALGAGLRVGGGGHDATHGSCHRP